MFIDGSAPATFAAAPMWRIVMGLFRLLASLLLSVIVVSGAAAEPLAKPQGKVILTISGKIANANSPKGAEFDRAMLENLGLVTVQTTTPWFDGNSRFEGVSMDKLMQLVGASGTKIDAIALNDYTVNVPLEDFKKFNVILAMKRNGAYMTVRDKGPLFIIYPYDSSPELQQQLYYARSAWQIAKFVVE